MWSYISAWKKLLLQLSVITWEAKGRCTGLKCCWWSFHLKFKSLKIVWKPWLSSGSCMIPCVSGTRWGAVIGFSPVKCKAFCSVWCVTGEWMPQTLGKWCWKWKQVEELEHSFAGLKPVCCSPFSLQPSLVLVLVYPRKALQGVNWPNSSFCVTFNGSHIQDHFSSAYEVWEAAELLSHFPFWSTKGSDSSECWEQQCFLSFSPKQSHPGACYFYYMEPLRNQAGEPLLPAVVALCIGANPKCPAVSPEIPCDNCITLPRNSVNIHVVIILVLGRDEGVNVKPSLADGY